MKIPDTPAGNQLQWYLAMMSSDMSGLTVAEADAHLKRRPDTSDEALRKDWRRWAQRLGECTVTGIVRDEPHEVVVAVQNEKDRRFHLTLRVEPEPPHKIDTYEWQRQYDFEVVVRDATPDDGAVLAEIERRAPIVMGDELVTFDRSADYLAAARLMEEAAVVMAEVDGEPAAVEWAACHRARIGGTDYRMANFIHLRVADKHQRKGLWGALVRKLNEHFPREVKVDEAYQCASRRNASIQQAFAGQASWSVGPIRALLSAADNAGPLDGVRSATLDDASLVVDLVNATHGAEEMYFPYTIDAIKARLERAPELYTWDQVWLTENAVVGVWPAGEQTKVITESNGKISEAKHGLVLDYGFCPGAEVEFEQLLRAWCGWLAARDHTHLSVFTSERSPGYHTIDRLAEHLERFDLWTPPIPEPPGAAINGVYMDQVYF